MNRKRDPLQNMTDEEVLREFVKRFQCDGAVLIYLDASVENGFGQWRNTTGRRWVNELFKWLNQERSVQLLPEASNKNESVALKSA